MKMQGGDSWVELVWEENEDETNKNQVFMQM